MNKIIKVRQISNDGSQAGTVINPDGLCFTICACTHGYAIGYVYDSKEISGSDEGKKSNKSYLSETGN